MTAGRPASLVATCDQWVRATHLRTAVDGAAGVLTLAWTDAPLPPAPEGDACIAPGLAIDRLCRVYRLEARALWRLRVGPTSAGLDYATLVEPTQIIGEPDAAAPSGSDFAPAPNPGLRRGVGIAIDRDDRLFLADADAQTISVLDLWSRRLLRQVRTDVPGHPDRHPMGLAADGSVVYAVVRNPSGLLRLSASRGPTELALPASVADLPPGAEPSRIAVLPDGEPVMLWHDETGDGWLVSGLRAPRRVGPASDIAVDAVGAVVIAPCPSPDGRASLRRLVATADDWTPVHPLDATGYDGSGLVATADGRVGYFTAAGFRLGVVAPVTYASDGRCVTYRLDSGVARNRWGRVLLEACVPDGTECLVGAATSDDEFETETVHVAASPAACLPATPSATPDLPPDRLVPAIESVSGRLHRRPGPTTPWWRDETSDRYETFEAPVHAAPGRYLWVTLRLQGNARRTPKVRELRVERTTHMLMRRLPTLYSLDERQERFLHRYLATFDGLLHDLDVRSSCRDILVDPHATPIEVLDWLAGFVGLVLDDRWADAARRQLVAEIVPLYRLRGTIWALSRYIEIFLAGEHAGETGRPEVSPVVIEHFRLRGVGGPIVGADPNETSRSVLGAGFRVGGVVGELGDRPLDPDADETSSHSSSAHRFSVLIPRSLGAEEESAIRHVLDTERPAHTTYELCTVDAGMRAGRGIHIGISSIVGPTGAFESAVTDRALIGRGAVLGGPTTGIAVEASRLDQTSRVG